MRYMRHFHNCVFQYLYNSPNFKEKTSILFILDLSKAKLRVSILLDIYIIYLFIYFYDIFQFSETLQVIQVRV